MGLAIHLSMIHFVMVVIINNKSELREFIDLKTNDSTRHGEIITPFVFHQ